MKTAILTALITVVTTTTAHAQSNQEYLNLLIDQDIVRTFYSPCNFHDLRTEIEVDEMQMYYRQGFVLLAKVKMPQPNPEVQTIPECMYSFVRKTHLPRANWIGDDTIVRTRNLYQDAEQLVVKSYNRAAVKVQDISAYIVGTIRGLLNRSPKNAPAKEVDGPGIGDLP